MMSLIISCCGTVKSVDLFEQARVACTQTNWEVPPSQPLARMLQILAGGNSDYDCEVAFNTLLAHLQQDEQRKNVTFVLKNLVILDFVVEERLFLSRMSRYYNSQLIYMEGEANKRMATIKELIGSYYVYIKEKAKYYQLQSSELLEQSQREKFMEKSNSITILNEVNVCFKIQNLILDVNSKYRSGDKSSQLVHSIFALLLKTYIFCHSIVSIALKTFVKRVPHLNRYDLEYIKKFATYFTKDYSQNFLNFLASNQSIPTFQALNYKQLMFADQKMLSIIDTQLQFINDDPGICPDPIQLSAQQLQALSLKKQQEMSVQQIRNPEPRKQLQLEQREVSEAFSNYVNSYSDTWQQESPDGKFECMDPYQIFGYYGVVKPEYAESQQSDQSSELEEEVEEKEEQDINEDEEIAIKPIQGKEIEANE